MPVPTGTTSMNIIAKTFYFCQRWLSGTGSDEGSVTVALGFLLKLKNNGLLCKGAVKT